MLTVRVCDLLLLPLILCCCLFASFAAHALDPALECTATPTAGKLRCTAAIKTPWIFELPAFKLDVPRPLRRLPTRLAEDTFAHRP